MKPKGVANNGVGEHTHDLQMHGASAGGQSEAPHIEAQRVRQVFRYSQDVCFEDCFWSLAARYLGADTASREVIATSSLPRSRLIHSGPEVNLRIERWR